MPDKKLTDSEITKALEICGTYKGKCTDCPAFVKVDRSNCKQVLLGAIEIINRLQADSKRLKKVQMQLDDAMKMYHVIKSEAYKEFAERLKMRAINRYNEYDNQEFPYATITHIDNLLKELVGE